MTSENNKQLRDSYGFLVKAVKIAGDYTDEKARKLVDKAIDSQLKAGKRELLEELEKKAKTYTPVTVGEHGNTYHSLEKNIVKAVPLSIIKEKKDSV